LVDYAAKGTQIALEGIEPVDGHNAYKLKLTLKNGNVQHIWIDAQSFLDVKVDGAPRRMDGKMRSVWISQRDFRSVQGLMVPYLYETAIDGSPHPHRMVIESVTVNRTWIMPASRNRRCWSPHHRPLRRPTRRGQEVAGRR